MGEGRQQEVLDLHISVAWDAKLDSIGEMLEPYRQHLESGARDYDMYADMPPIQQVQIPPDMQPQNLAQ